MKIITDITKLKTTLNFINKTSRPILRNVLVKDDSIILTDIDNHIKLKSNYGLKNGLHKLDTIGLIDPDLSDLENYPVINFDPTIKESFKICLSDLESLLPFCSKDYTRVNLQGIAVNEGHLVACDGYTLKAIELEYSNKENYLINRDSVSILIKLLKKFSIKDKISFKFSSDFLLVDTDAFTFVSRLVDREYPRWKVLFPNKYNLKGTVTSWINIKTIRPLLDKKTNRVQIVADNNQLVLSLYGHDNHKYVIGETTDSFVIDFNLELLDRAASQNKEFEIKLNNSMTPALVNDAIVMPLKAA